MRVLCLIGILVFQVILLRAQEREILPQMLSDTIRIEMAGRYEPDLVLPGSVLPNILSPQFMPLIEVPEFDFSPWLHSRWKMDHSAGINGFQWGRRSPLFFQDEFFGLPGTNGVILNQATYRLSDKFKLGGNSFGAGSLLSASLRKPGSDQWEWRGASMFLQYKVSKNFRIETHVSVSGNQFNP